MCHNFLTCLISKWLLLVTDIILFVTGFWDGIWASGLDMEMNPLGVLRSEQLGGWGGSRKLFCENSYFPYNIPT
jgi:hypothetical protein